MGNIFNKFADMFVPKEIAPYLGMIAPMLATPLGITPSLLLSQAGSWKERGGKWDPYSALATGIALSSPQARQMREMGRMNVREGTVGQKLSAGFGKTFTKEGSKASNWFDPTTKMGGDYASDYINQVGDDIWYMTKDDKLWGKDPGYEKWKKDNWEDTKQGYKDWKYGKDAWATEPTITGRVGDKEMPEFLGETGIDVSKNQGNLSDEQYAKYLKADNKKKYLEGLGKVDAGYDPGFLGKAADFGSDLAGAIFPGWYDSYDPVTGKGVGSLNFSNVIQTITVAATLSSVMAIKDELEKEKDLDEAEERKIWKEWFDSYERTSGHTYEFSPYREEHLWEMYQKYMAKGGRVGYNLGGGIMEAPGVSQGMQAPGVPQGMQLDGRDGAFVPQGIEEKADDVPAMLSKNEFVLTADAMRGLDKIMGGRGDPRAAAQHMYQMMDQLEAVA